MHGLRWRYEHQQQHGDGDSTRTRNNGNVVPQQNDMCLRFNIVTMKVHGGKVFQANCDLLGGCGGIDCCDQHSHCPLAFALLSDF